MSAANWGILVGEAKYFVSGPKCPPRNDFQIVFGALTEKPVRTPGAVTEMNFCRIIFGVWYEPRLRPQKKGLLAERGSYRNNLNSSGIIFWVLAGFLVRAPGHLPHNTFCELFW